MVELLVVIAIIGLLLSIALPGLGRAREAGRRVVCLSNLRQLGSGMHMFASHGTEVLPPLAGWSHRIAPMMQVRSVGGIFECPTAKTRFDSASARTYGYNRFLDRVPLTYVLRPSQIILVADGHWSGAYFYAQVDAGIARPTPVHDDRVAAVFLDLHGKLVDDTPQEFFREE